MHDTIRNIKYMLFGRFVTLSLAFFFTSFLFRALSIEEFGTYSLILSFVWLVQTLSDLGIGEATKYYLAEAGDNIKKARIVFSTGFTSLFLVSLVSSFIIFIFSGILARIYNLPLPYFIFASLFVLAVVSEVSFEQALESRKKFVERSLIYIILTLTRFSAFIFIFLGFSSFGGLLGEFFSGIISILLSFFVLRKIAGFGWNLKIFKKLLSYARRIVLSTFISLFQTNGIILILGYFTLTGNGIFTALLKMMVLLTAFSENVNSVLFPKIVELDSNRKELKKQFSEFMKYTIIIPIFIGGVCILFANRILFVVYGLKMTGNELTFIIIVLSSVIDAIAHSFYKILVGLNKPELATKGLTFRAFITITSAIILIPSFGEIGAALSLLFASIFGNTLIMKYAHDIFQYSFPIRTLFVSVLSMLLLSIPIVLLLPFFTGYNAIILGLIVSPIYPLLLVLFKEIKEKDFRYALSFLGIK